MPFPQDPHELEAVTRVIEGAVREIQRVPYDVAVAWLLAQYPVMRETLLTNAVTEIKKRMGD